jgi:hypothetical protein
MSPKNVHTNLHTQYIHEVLYILVVRVVGVWKNYSARYSISEQQDPERAAYHSAHCSSLLSTHHAPHMNLLHKVVGDKEKKPYHCICKGQECIPASRT